MENKKTIIAIIIVVILIIGLIAISYLYNDFNTKQVNILTEESNKLLQMDIATEEIDFKIKTDKNYAIVEKAMKEYLIKLKNIYLELDEINSNINPNYIFSARNLQDKNLEEIEVIISEYKEKGNTYLSEYRELIKDEKILENINERKITSRRNYYTNLYNTVMLGEVMKEQYSFLEEKVERKKDELYDKLNKMELIKKYLDENNRYWTIKDEKIQFTNINKMTEYYGLLNELVD